jgi:hypothetical protein
MRGDQPLGAPYTASAADTFEGGWRFRLHLRPSQAGYLYLITEGPDENGANRLWILHPRSSAAPVPANQDVQTGWYDFDANPGTEKLWIVWSAALVPAIEEALSTSSNGRVQSQNRFTTIERLLASAGRGPEGNGQLTTKLLQLKHR